MIEQIVISDSYPPNLSMEQYFDTANIYFLPLKMDVNNEVCNYIKAKYDTGVIIGTWPDGDAFYIVSGGNIGIGTNNPGQKLDIAGGNGRVETGYSWLSNSDSRLKNNISTLEGSLDKISRLRGVRFDSKEVGHVNKGDGKHIGVIAQELEKEYPELVVGDKKTGYKAVAYDKLTAVLIEAVKELKNQNEKQKAEIEELRSMIKGLNS